MKKILILVLLLLCFACGKKEKVKEEVKIEKTSNNPYQNYVDKNIKAKNTAQDVANKLSKQIKDNEKQLDEMGQ